jgi:hypothetical protein
MCVIGFLTHVHPKIPHKTTTLYHKVRDRLGYGDRELRFAKLFQLKRAVVPVPDMREVRRALEVRAVEERTPLPDEDIYPRDGWLGQYLAYVENSECPLSYHFWSGVSVLGAACRRNIWFELGYCLYPNQYTIIIGDTAEGKSLAINATTPLIELANATVLEHASGWPEVGPFTDITLESGDYPNPCIEVLPERSNAPTIIQCMVPPTPHNVRLRDTNKEITLTGVDSVAWLANDEMSNWLSRNNKLADEALKIITTFYNCQDRWYNRTVGRGKEPLYEIALNLLCGSTLEWINRSVTKDMFEGGFMSRVMFIYRSRAPKPVYDKTPPPAKDPVLATILAEQMAAWMCMKEPAKAVLEESALPVYSDLKLRSVGQTVNPDDPKLANYFVRKVNHVMKLAMTLMVSRQCWPGITSQLLHNEGSTLWITRDDLEKAIELVEFEEQYLPEAFARIGEHPHAAEYREIQSRVEAYNISNQRPMPLSVLGAAMKGSMSLKDLKQRVEELCGIGDLCMDGIRRKGRGGRPLLVVWAPRAFPWPPD